MAEHYFHCRKCWKITRSVPASFSELAADEINDNLGARSLALCIEGANFLSGGLMMKGIGVFLGDAYKCTECAFVRLIGSDGKEKI